jgi:hypothetical protein
MPDIDLDFPDRNKLLARLPHRIARLETYQKTMLYIIVTETILEIRSPLLFKTSRNVRVSRKT